MVHFCLLVDRLVSEDKFEAEDAEQALLWNDLNEEETKKHLRGFIKLKDLGFPPENIHKALIEASADHDKALEILLK